MLKKITTKDSKVCFGMINKASGGFYLPFFDYDFKDNYEKIIEDLTNLQSIYFLSDIFIFKSENGYNAFSLDKLPYNIFKNLCENSKYICKDFRRLGLDRGFLVLRFGHDKILQYILLKKGKYKKSLCHYEALKTFYDVDVSYDMREFDKNLILKIYAYRSIKHGFMTVKKL